MYKINVLHLHVSDDQAFRIVINGFPNLTTLGSTGSVGTGGRMSDSGGSWTQQDYKNVVAYATAHFMTVMPEVDSPGHNNAIINSEYGDTATRFLTVTRRTSTAAPTTRRSGTTPAPLATARCAPRAPTPGRS